MNFFNICCIYKSEISPIIFYSDGNDGYGDDGDADDGDCDGDDVDKGARDDYLGKLISLQRHCVGEE